MIRQVEDESVILNLQTTQYSGLDDVGTQMWAVLTTAATIQEAFETLQATYDVEPDRLEKDLLDLIGKLLEQGVLELESL